MEKNMKFPMISVVMPVYNGEKFIGKAIESILNQTYKDFELIIINDGSKDRTLNIVKEYSDSRIRLIDLVRNVGLVKVRNIGIKNSNGKYIAWLDSDDISNKSRLKKQVNFLENNPSIGICGSWVRTFGLRESLWKFPTSSELIKAKLLFVNCFATSSVMLRKSVLTKYDLEFDRKFPLAEDYNLWEKISNHCNVANISDFLTYHRIHQNQTTASQSTVMYAFEVQRRMLERLKVVMNIHDEELHIKTGLRQNYNFNNIDEIKNLDKWFMRLIDQNLINCVYDQNAFETVVAKRWFKIVSQNAYLGLSVFGFYFFKSELPKQKKIFDIFKLFVKCLIRYKVYK